MDISSVNKNCNIYLRYGYLMFPVNLKIAPEVRVDNKRFFYKEKYHVSLIRLCDYSDQQQKRILKFAQSFNKRNPIKLKEITNIFRLVTEGERQSIIVRVKMKGLKKLISSVNLQFGLKIVHPPTHITLYTLKDQFGIDVDTFSRYKLLTKEINLQKHIIRGE